MSNELYHHGVKGMHWGVRRYQNKDGSLTNLGRRRLGVDSSIKFTTRKNRTFIDKDDETSRIKGYTKIRTEVSADNIQMSKAQRGASESFRTSSGFLKRSADRDRAKAVSKIDLSNMSDAELRSLVNRMNMERQYKSLKAEEINYGRDKVSEKLVDIGDIAAIAANVASIGAAIALIRK